MSEPHNTIRTYALVLTAITSLVLITFAAILIYLLQSDWCASAVGAADDAGRPETAVQACFVLLTLQVKALANGWLIILATFALCLGVLVTIVIAGGRLSFAANKSGVSGDIGKDRGVRSAKRVEQAAAGAAAEERAEIEQEAAGTDNFERDTQ